MERVGLQTEDLAKRYHLFAPWPWARADCRDPAAAPSSVNTATITPHSIVLSGGQMRIYLRFLRSHLHCCIYDREGQFLIIYLSIFVSRIDSKTDFILKHVCYLHWKSPILHVPKRKGWLKAKGRSLERGRNVSEWIQNLLFQHSLLLERGGILSTPSPFPTRHRKAYWLRERGRGRGKEGSPSESITAGANPNRNFVGI